MPKLSDIELEITNVLDVDESELTEEQFAALDGYLEELAGQEADKIDGFAQFCRLQGERISALEAESKRLARRAKSLERGMNYLKVSYLSTMQRHGLQKLNGNVYAVSIRKTPVVRIEDEKAIPAEYWTEKVERSISKTMIKDALKQGQEVPGACMAESYSLQVR